MNRSTKQRLGLIAAGVVLTMVLAGCGDDGAPGSECTDTCPDVVAEGCPGGPPTLADCESGCEDTRLACPTELSALFDCGGANPTYSCGANGRVYTDGCEPEHDDLYACLFGVPAACVDTCPGAVAEGCPSGPPDVPSCESGCADTRTLCPTQFDAVIQCGGASPTFSCGDNGMVYTDGCEPEQNDLYACLWEIPVTCIETCPDVFAEGCANGPPSLDDCHSGCASSQAQCPTQFDAVIQCGGANPTYSCGTNDMIYTDGCETQQDALYACMAL